MNYWILKTEPGAYSYGDLVKDGKTLWDGVRNYQARNNLKAMKKNDIALIYHSVTDKEVVGTSVVTKEHFQDPTDNTGTWVVVEIKPKSKLKKTVSLAEIKSEKILSDISLVKHSRLSVMPITKKHFDKILKMSS